MKNNSLKNKIKILIATHKPFKIPKGSCFLPIHAGRAIALDKSKDGIISKSDFKWLKKHTIGDDSGNSISDKNRLYCEVSAIYWAWKNYEQLGNPEYIGLMHYRRFFVFNDKYYETQVKDNYQKGLCFIPVSELNSKCIKNIGLSDSNINKICSDADIIVTKNAQLDVAYNYDEQRNIRGDYKISIPGVDVKDFDLMMELVKEKYPDYYEIAKLKINGYSKSLYNMFIMKKEIFFEMCEFLFNILFEIEKQVDFSKYSVNGMRTLGYLSEILISMFIWKVEEYKQYKVKKLGTIFISNPIGKKPYEFLQKLFSIYNENKHKIICIAGIKLKIKIK